MRKHPIQGPGSGNRSNESVQDFIPIKRVRNGIIETRDGRYVKVIEIEPINFSLRSPEEQYNIICSFASWLKIAPASLQFKSISRKADSDKHIALLQKDLENETNPQCLRLAGEYIKLIKDVGSREALSRRFFLIFQYEPPPGRRPASQSYAEVISLMQTVVQNCRAFFLHCGNSIIIADNEDAFTAEMLYTFFNRKSCGDNPFSKRVERVVMDTMRLKKRVLGKDPVPEIPVSHFISPRGIDLTHYNYFIMDGMYFCVLYIRRHGYPNAVRAGWTQALINAGEGIDVDIYLRRENRSRTLDRVSQRIRLNRTKLKNTADTSTDFEDVSNAINAGYYIKSAISNHNEDLFYISTFITISAKTYDEMMWRKNQIADMLKSMDIYTGESNWQQEAALLSVMPVLKIDANLQKKTQRNLMTSGAASTYMFTSYELSDDNGVLLGLNRHNNSLCILDFFNTRIYKNANVTMLGTSGAGKTFTMQLLALRMRMRGIQCFILAPLKGHEFKRACHNIGGSFIKISPGSADCINVMEIRATTSPDMELIDEIETGNSDSLLAKKIQQLMIFFALLIPDMTNEEEQMLDEALIATYREMGISHNNESLYSGSENGAFKTMPILGDLHRQLSLNPMMARVAIIVSRFVTGSAVSFNQQTNVDLSNKYIVLDISELKGKLLPVGMFIALDYVWDAIKSNRTTRKAVFIDEVWQLIGANSNRQAAEFVLEIFKIIRGYGGGAFAATQDLSDFFSLDDGKYGRAIINNSKTKIILNLEPDEAQYVQDTLKLTRTEIRSITQFERGEALISSNSNKVPVTVKASRAEQQLITTDRAELASLVREKQMKKPD